MTRWLIAVLVLVPLPALADEPDPEPPPAGSKQLDGEWEVVGMRLAGKERKTPAGWIMKFAKGKMTATRAGRETVNTFKIDPRKSPPHIDITYGTTNRTNHAIYKLEKDELSIAYGGATPAARPTDIASARQVLVLKRQKK
jgi:uncharacterized protein (TIGR03067 family)